MSKTLISEPADIIPKVIKVLQLAGENKWNEDDLYCIAKVILAHFETK
ncbi:hypothetical protein KM914_14365 [Virgibacillus pantothenticus]|nr:hypothetical protein [Virgibacillus pantothenticus]MBU8567604.1 hypothetical protein [Virgibacillus pantothenticus]MBU8601392.1 hypothetical protein [Virgibacillus pantothenticus]MBU8636209.1 hypothetical protein [Virgibacillus pantothenticus]MBU8643729.1 hypothetical protein [Virgibacillus pantothenticus]MBU8648015.1 hypothetical protein [Virgibacillus pantothenticus]